jgi:hypothetical protein
MLQSIALQLYLEGSPDLSRCGPMTVARVCAAPDPVFARHRLQRSARSDGPPWWPYPTTSPTTRRHAPNSSDTARHSTTLSGTPSHRPPENRKVGGSTPPLATVSKWASTRVFTFRSGWLPGRTWSQLGARRRNIPRHQWPSRARQAASLGIAWHCLVPVRLTRRRKVGTATWIAVGVPSRLPICLWAARIQCPRSRRQQHLATATVISSGSAD